MLDILSSIFADVGIDTVPWYVLDIFQELFGRVGGAILCRAATARRDINSVIHDTSQWSRIVHYLSGSSLPMGVANVCDKGHGGHYYIPTVLTPVTGIKI